MNHCLIENYSLTSPAMYFESLLVAKTTMTSCFKQHEDVFYRVYNISSDESLVCHLIIYSELVCLSSTGFYQLLPCECGDWLLKGRNKVGSSSWLFYSLQVYFI